MFWKYIIVEGLSWAEARNEVVRKARKENFEWLLFIDDDVFLPEDAVKKLLSRQKNIISGIYWVKSEVDNPVIFKRFGAGPYFDFPIGEVFEIGGHISVFQRELGYGDRIWSEDEVSYWRRPLFLLPRW